MPTGMSRRATASAVAADRPPARDRALSLRPVTAVVDDIPNVVQEVGARGHAGSGATNASTVWVTDTRSVSAPPSTSGTNTTTFLTHWCSRRHLASSRNTDPRGNSSFASADGVPTRSPRQRSCRVHASPPRRAGAGAPAHRTLQETGRAASPIPGSAPSRRRADRPPPRRWPGGSRRPPRTRASTAWPANRRRVPPRLQHRQRRPAEELSASAGLTPASASLRSRYSRPLSSHTAMLKMPIERRLQIGEQRDDQQAPAADHLGCDEDRNTGFSRQGAAGKTPTVVHCGNPSLARTEASRSRTARY